VLLRPPLKREGRYAERREEAFVYQQASALWSLAFPARQEPSRDLALGFDLSKKKADERRKFHDFFIGRANSEIPNSEIVVGWLLFSLSPCLSALLVSAAVLGYCAC
jgi:hypothetical protein